MYDIKALGRADNLLGEGPLWDHRTERLLWIDILRGRVHAWSEESGSRQIVQVDALIGSIALAGQSDLLLATSRGLLRRDGTSGEMQLLANPIAGRSVRFNDGRVDALGRFWVGTMPLEEDRYAEPLGELYRYDPDGSLHRMEQGLTISNGLDWSPDGTTFYLTDTMRRAIYAYGFDLETGTIRNRRTLVRTSEADGYPDGLVIDRNGNLWSAGFGGSVICRYDTRGRLVGKIAMPVSCPTALTFGGMDSSTAFITTSQHALPPNHTEEHAGALLSIGLGVSGRPDFVFGEGVAR